MKKFRKIIALGLAATAAVSAMSITAFADDIQNENSDIEYSVTENSGTAEVSDDSIEPKYTTYTYMVNASSGANMRRSPGLSGAIITTLPKGTIVTFNTRYNIITPKDGYHWRYVLYNGTYGYVADEYLDLYTSLR